MVLCRDNTYYTGITTDLKRRIHEHNATGRGARYTRSRRPVHLVYWETAPDKSTASKREYVVRKLPRLQKIQLIADNRNKEEISQAASESPLKQIL